MRSPERPRHAMADEMKDSGITLMLDAIRRSELLQHHLSKDGRWIDVDGDVAGIPFLIQIMLPGDKWATPSHLRALPPVALRYESRMASWNLDYMIAAFDGIYGRHPAISGPWVTVVRREDERCYHGRDAWDMNLVASKFRAQRGLKPTRRRSSSETEGTAVGEDVLRVEIHSGLRTQDRVPVKDTVLEFHRDGDTYREVVRFDTRALCTSQPEFLERVLQNVLWGGDPTSVEVAALRTQLVDLVELL